MRKALDQLGPLAPVHVGGLGAVALVALAGWLLVARPSSAHEAERELTTRRLAEAEPRLRELEQSLSDTRAATVAARERLESSHGQLSGVGLRNERLTGLTTLAVECGLRIDRMEPSEVVREGMFLTMPIRMEGVGGYPECARFLHLLLERFSDMKMPRRSRSRQAGEERAPGRSGFDLVWYADPAGDTRMTEPIGGRRPA
ncbi:MAG: type 4a pilus biogenesis protein PilO [Phycisphaerales bacterium]